ncbi:MAG TPA: hypothetical protein VJM80_12345 [bacterium]|nr:hypothetical protein [bacterium]
MDDALLGETYDRFVGTAYKKYPYPSLEGIQTALDFLKDKIEKAKTAQFVDESFLETDARGRPAPYSAIISKERGKCLQDNV